eukprot:jgi/Botrbrau1/5734/Bobra.0134s0009.1
MEVTAPSCNKFFTVRAGDICFNIWNSYGLSEAQFRSLNPGINCDNLQIGQTVCVGGSSPPGPAGEGQFSGDATWYDDAGVTSCGEYVPGDGDYAAISWPQSDALDSNCRSNPNNCNWCNKRVVVTGPAGSATVRLLDKPGTSMLVPVASCNKFFTVRAGDICFNIWNSYRLSEAQFRALNPGINCDNLQIGERVCVGSGRPTPPPVFEVVLTGLPSQNVNSKQKTQRSDGHAQQLAWRESCNLRHIGYENLAGGGPIGGQTNSDMMRVAINMWQGEGPGAFPEHGHYNAMTNGDMTRIGCSTQRGPDGGGPDCWVVMCSYATAGVGIN